MATPPFAAPFEASLKQPIQGGVFELLSGHVVYPQFFCCTTCTNVGVPKAPVALIKADDTYACVGAIVCIDILGSWSPTSTLASYNVDWDDGNNSPGAWPPAGDICHPLGGYAVADTYEITLTVTDLLGTTDEDIVEFDAVDCAHLPPYGPPPIPPATCWPPCRNGCDPVLGSFILIGSSGAGPYYTLELDGAATNWTLLGTGLAGGGRVGHVLVEIRWQTGFTSIFMGTNDGIWEYFAPLGMPLSGYWIRLQSAMNLFTAAGLVETPGAPDPSIYVYEIKMSMEHEGWGYCTYGVLEWPNMWGCVAHTRDGWLTIANATDVTNQAGSDIKSSCSIAQHSNASTIYAAFPGWANSGKLWRSTNYGGAWTMLDAPVIPTGTVVHVPWNSENWNDRIIYWGSNGIMRRSLDGGASFATIGAFGRPYNMNGPTYTASTIWFSQWNPNGEARYWDPIGGANSFGPAMCVGCHCYDAKPIVFDPNSPLCLPLMWLLVGDGGVNKIHLNTSVAATNCTGDWNVKTGDKNALCIMGSDPTPLNFDTLEIV